MGRSPYRTQGRIASNPRVGNVHCRLIRQDGRYWVMDLNSLNGTYINGQRLLGEECRPLADKDVLKLADCAFLVAYD